MNVVIYADSGRICSRARQALREPVIAMTAYMALVHMPLINGAIQAWWLHMLIVNVLCAPALLGWAIVVANRMIKFTAVKTLLVTAPGFSVVIIVLVLPLLLGVAVSCLVFAVAGDGGWKMAAGPAVVAIVGELIIRTLVRTSETAMGHKCSA